MEEVTWKYNKKTHNIKIQNSLLIQDRKEMIEFLKQVPLEKVNRTLKSAVNEWVVHNSFIDPWGNFIDNLGG